MNFRQLLVIIFAFCLFSTAIAAPDNDPLPSWNDGKIKQSIINFVHNVTDPQNSSYVAQADRIATFDNDGTLWVEQPMYTQMKFAIDRIKALSPQHPEWATEEPYKSVLANDNSQLNMKDLEHIIGVTHSGMSIQDFQEIEKQWLTTTKDHHFDRYYTDLIYQPMLEVMNYLRDNNFKVYIVSGGGQQFIRAYSDKTYGVPSEQVIGTAGKTKFVYRDDKPQLIKTADVLFVDDKAGKPEAINLFIGKKPIIAFGNSDGDKEMLEWTQSGGKNNLMFLVHHDDAQREFAYDENTKVGTFSHYLLEAANENHWGVISMKHDWKVIFPPLVVNTTPAATAPAEQPTPTPAASETKPLKKAKVRKKLKQHAEREYEHHDNYIINY